MSFIVSKNIYKSYLIGGKKNKILNGVNLSVNFNEFVAIMGSSGSGKSTILYILGLLDNPDSGEIIINNEVMNKKSSEEKTKIRLKYIGYVFQDFFLISEMTLYENVALTGITDGMSTKLAYARAKKILRQVGLGAHVNKKPTQLSGGQQQRVAIARALMNEPLILFADEPTANLDSKTSLEILELFKTLQRENRLTIVMVTHEEEFRNKVDRVITLKDGVVID